MSFGRSRVRDVRADAVEPEVLIHWCGEDAPTLPRRFFGERVTLSSHTFPNLDVLKPSIAVASQTS